MLFRLALALGKTISELQQTLTHSEFIDWCAFYQLEPWGENRADLRAGIIASTMTNLYASWVGSKTTTNPADFMPTFEPHETRPTEERQLTDEELAAWADAVIYGLEPEQKQDDKAIDDHS